MSTVALLPELKTPAYGSARAAVKSMMRSVVPPRSTLTVSEWADRYRVLDKSAAEPGRWRTDRNPPARAVQDAFTDPAVRRIVIMACTQLLKTEAIFNMLGYAIDQDPGPTLWVGTVEDEVRRFAKNRAQALVRESQQLAQYIPANGDDFSSLDWNLERCLVLFAWAGSPSRLSQWPMRYVFADEVDKYPPYSGAEAEPIALAEKRQGTFWNAKTVLASTPTKRSGNIYREMERSLWLQCHIECPHCGAWIVLTFQQVKWPEEPPDAIRAGTLAWYECQVCGGRIDDTMKIAMLRHCVWAPEGWLAGTPRQGPVPTPAEIAAAIERGHVPFAYQTGFHISRLYSPWLSGRFSEIAAEFLLVHRDPAKLMDFVTQTLAQAWEEKVEANEPDELKLQILTEQPEGLVPPGGLVLTAGVDVQLGHFYYVIRAWGVDMESWLVRAHRVESWAALEADLFLTGYQVARDDASWQPGGGQPLFVRLACIDARYDTRKVHRFVKKWRDVARATLGRDRLVRPYELTILDKNAGGQAIKGGRQGWHVDTSHYKDVLSRLIHTDPGDASQWHVYDSPGEHYFSQMCAEHKIVIRVRTTMKTREAWVPVSASAPNHYWDAEVYCLAAADMRQVQALRPGAKPIIHKPRGSRKVAQAAALPDAPAAAVEPEPAAAAAPRERPARESRRGPFLHRHSNWLRR